MRSKRTYLFGHFLHTFDKIVKLNYKVIREGQDQDD